jgi:hypothetical protein
VPEITLSLLTPISIRLSWSGSGDFEVWWKSDHPAGQEYTKLALVTGTTYDVGSLSWTTTYYFKVRQVGGAFGSEIHVFVCCGQAVVYGNPPGEDVPPPTFLATEYWQQAACPGNDLDVTFVGKNIPHTSIYIWDFDGPTDIWSFGKMITYLGNFFPVGVRQQGEKVAIIDTENTSAWYLAAVFTFYNKIYNRTSWPIPEGWWSVAYHPEHPSNIYSDLGADYSLISFSFRSTANSIAFNEDFRIVLGLYMEAWPSDIDDMGADNNVFQVITSRDFGQTWANERIYTSQGQDPEYEFGGLHSSIAEDGSGNVWCVVQDVYLDPSLRWIPGTGGWVGDPDDWSTWPGYNTAIDPVGYFVIKWVEGSGATVIREIVSTLVEVYEGPPNYALLEPGYYAKCHNVAAEESKIAVAYLYSYTKDNPVTYRYYGNYVFKLDISTDGGSSWATKTITGSWKGDPEWAGMLPAICVSDGNIIVYLIGGTYAAPTRHIMRSTDNGDTWSEVYNFSGIVAFDYPWVAQLQSKGSHVTLTGCKFGVTSDGPLAFFESFDAGATWTPVEIIPPSEEEILVPA